MSLKALDNFYFGTASPASGGVTPTGEISITKNGNYDVTEYATANVNTPSSDIIQATNMTGADIAVGDKVFLKENVAVAQSSINIIEGSTNDKTFALNPTGTKVVYDKYIYDVATNSSIYSSSDTFPPRAYINLRYANNNKLYALIYRSSTSILTTDITSGFQALSYTAYMQDNWFITKVNDSSGVYATISKVENGLVTKTININSSDLSTTNYSFFTGIIIGNKIYLVNHVPGKKTLQYFVGTIDEESLTVNNIYLWKSISTYYSYLDTSQYEYISNTTIDNKLCLFANAVLLQRSNYFKGVALSFKEIESDGTISDNTFVSSNEDLNSLIGNTSVCFTFNRNTGMLGITQFNGNSYGLFKYNPTTMDFDTISLTLIDYVGGTYQNLLTVSNDMSKLVAANYLYTLEQTAGGYKAIPYSGNMGSDVLTGYATSSATHGQVFNASTVLGA